VARGLPQLILALLVFPAAGQSPVSTTGERIATAAARQVGVTRHYDPSYVRLRYPDGDVPLDRGVCTDVVIRSFRAAGIDLQREVHQDMRANFRAYPQNWGLRRADSNIDHRRVPNLMRYFERRGKAVPRARERRFLPGDVVAWRLPNGLHHIGIVSQARAPGGRHPLVIHNIGAGTQEEDVLFAFEIIGHYRW
jgi:uncharacterized protein